MPVKGLERVYVLNREAYENQSIRILITVRLRIKLYGNVLYLRLLASDSSE